MTNQPSPEALPDQATHLEYEIPAGSIPTHVHVAAVDQETRLVNLETDMAYIVGIAKRVEDLIASFRPEDIEIAQKRMANPFVQRQLAKMFGSRDFPDVTP